MLNDAEFMAICSGIMPVIRLKSDAFVWCILPSFKGIFMSFQQVGGIVSWVRLNCYLEGFLYTEILFQEVHH